MEPVSSLDPDQTEWQRNVSKPDIIHANKGNQSIHVQSVTRINAVSSPSSLGMEPIS
jgi:hypothetical protein